MEKLKELVREEVGRLTGFVAPGGSTGLRNAFLSGKLFDEIDDRIEASTEETIKVIIHDKLTPPDFGETPPQYGVFQYVPSTAWILNYNTDGLAQRYCPQRVIPVHGSVSPSFTERLALSEILPWTQEGVRYSPRTLWYPQSEPPGFLEEIGLSGIVELFEDPSNVVIIGYSFGMGSGTFDDMESYRLLTGCLRDTNTRVVVIDPFGTELAGALSEDLRSNLVDLVPAFWNYLSQSIIQVTMSTTSGALSATARRAQEVADCYARML